MEAPRHIHESSQHGFSTSLVTIELCIKCPTLVHIRRRRGGGIDNVVFIDKSTIYDVMKVSWGALCSDSSSTALLMNRYV